MLFFMKVLTVMRNKVGPGSLPPKPEKTSLKTGTTTTMRKMVMPMATMVTATGYISEDLTFLRRRAVFSR